MMERMKKEIEESVIDKDVEKGEEKKNMERWTLS